jgi:hypothetical protein
MIEAKQNYNSLAFTQTPEHVMNNTITSFSIEVTGTKGKCPVGEKVAQQNKDGGKIPVLSCEGACIRGEIARLAANLVAKEDRYRRGCHGEFLTVPDSTMTSWINGTEKVVLIDGCFLRCHGRILENMIDRDKLVQFDALSHYKKYTDRFDIDSVPENERKEVAGNVADWVLVSLQEEDK